jgi:hypothetical protein
MDWTRPNLKSQKILLKINLNILTFYITLITFYYYSNKKITTKQKKLFFYTKYSYFFPYINQICYSTSPLPQVQSIAKHIQFSLNAGLQDEQLCESNLPNLTT